MKIAELVTLFLKWALARLAAKVKQDPERLVTEARKLIAEARALLDKTDAELSQL